MLAELIEMRKISKKKTFINLYLSVCVLTVFLFVLSISSVENINLIIEKCNGDRNSLKNELNKIKNYLINKKKISSEEILKIINLSENYELSELVDNCLAKNKNKISS